jgi:hypothetical protein
MHGQAFYFCWLEGEAEGPHRVRQDGRRGTSARTRQHPVPMGSLILVHEQSLSPDFLGCSGWKVSTKPLATTKMSRACGALSGRFQGAESSHVKHGQWRRNCHQSVPRAVLFTGFIHLLGCTVKVFLALVEDRQIISGVPDASGRSSLILSTTKESTSLRCA